MLDVTTTGPAPRTCALAPRVRALALGAALLACGIARAQTLALRHYGVAEGLASGRVNCIRQDSRGYLWFGTWEGLSRFDGVEFRSYGTREGLSNFLLNAIAEDRDGNLWVATQGGGVARLVDRPLPGPADAGSRRVPLGSRRAPLFENHRVGATRESNIVNALLFDADGSLWCGTEAGVFRGVRAAEGPAGAGEVRFERVVLTSSFDWSQLALRDRDGRLWFGVKDEIVEIEAGRLVARHAAPEPIATLEEVVALAERPGGGLVVAFGKGVFELERAGHGAPAWKRVPISLDASQQARCLLVDSAGTLWIGTTAGLIRFRDGEVAVYTAANGLSDISIRALCEDREQNLWIGTWSSGVFQLAGESIASFLDESAMPDRTAIRVLEDRQGRIFATGRTGIVRIERDRIEVVRGSRDPAFERIGARILQDRRGDWWIGTERGLHFFPGPELALEGGRRLGEPDGVAEAGVFGAIHEDPDGRIRFGMTDGHLYTWDPARSPTPRFERRELREALGIDAPREILLDSSGQLWLAPYVGLARFVGERGGAVLPAEGLPDLQPRYLFEDHRGWLWVATRFHGVSVTRDPSAERPRFEDWTAQRGLASDAVWSVAEDAQGRIYLGTSRGLEQLEPESGRVLHLTTADGLAGDIVNHVIRDRAGFIWAATSGGVSRFDPQAKSPPSAPPPIRISRVQAAGEELPLPESGAREILEIALDASQSNLSIGFVGLSFRGGRALSYQHRLEGIDRDWSPPSALRAVDYAQLAPGSYRFLVRAVHEDGTTSVEPASVSFRIRPPFWRTGWFVSAAAALVAAVAYGLHRSRVRRILALEAVRRQIATDIHDDMGAGLAQIAILSEVVKRDVPPAAQGTLDEVAKLARALRDSMSDIVWAVDPRRDRFGDLVQRMRQVAYNLLEAEGLSVEFSAPDDRALAGVGLAPDKRRHLLLILKESLANVARHAGASEVKVEVHPTASSLRLSIEDDGRGFDPAVEHEGHGLANLRQRAQALAARLEIRSAPGAGTTIVVTVPL